MRNHPAEKARQIAAMERAGIDPRVGTWPGDPGGPSAEARLQGDNAAAPNRATRKHERDARRELLEEVLEGPEPVPTASWVLERDAYAADLEADRLLAQSETARAKAEHLRDVAVAADGDGFALCSVCGAGTSDCQTDGCGIAPEDARNADVLGIRADVLYDLAQDIEAQARSHADRAVLLRARSEDLQDRADGAA